MTSVIQISDTHFGTEQPQVVDALAQLVHEQSPELVVVSGDITQRARRAQFRAAKVFLDSLDARNMVIIPGNHDIPLYDVFTRAFRPYAKFAREFGQELEPEYESEGLLVITVKTTRRYRHVDGEVSMKQIERVAKRLISAKPQQLRIVVTHQPVSVIRPEDEENLLNGHEKAIPSWCTAGADLILGGHIHLPYVCPLHERLGNGARKLWAVQAGTAVSSRIRHEAGNSVNIVRYEPAEPHTIQVEQWDYQVGSRKFAMTKVHSLSRDGTVGR
ncbi:MAG TPA: metallophosphoesterase [Methylophilaceae bacterium]|nr:metallophosphoesterase [Methylophilaceae bacterium]